MNDPQKGFTFDIEFHLITKKKKKPKKKTQTKNNEMAMPHLFIRDGYTQQMGIHNAMSFSKQNIYNLTQDIYR